ncbi:methyltransferase, TIGR04325 family [Ruegeria atlantica]|uniref:methyltransferase, TIGR04325 family n=1 Tax=Ruegeria atlantica TaxID=81569 RepID=UPI00147C31D1|nr:methyltransferase, TIGR04325 family [Ruegeria atlantica]
MVKFTVSSVTPTGIAARIGYRQAAYRKSFSVKVTEHIQIANWKHYHPKIRAAIANYPSQCFRNVNSNERIWPLGFPESGLKVVWRSISFGLRIHTGGFSRFLCGGKILFKSRETLKFSLSLLKRGIGLPVSAAWARLMTTGIRPPAMVGAYPNYATAAVKAHGNGYNDKDVAQVNTDLMRKTVVWDYPVIHWINEVFSEGMHLLDAGGHFGSKYIAFRDLCPIDRLQWTVYDLPVTVDLARAAQESQELPAEIVFQDDLAKVGQIDVLLGSGLMQYLDISLAELIGKLDAPPKYILLNKVATRCGPTVVTLEKIGPGRVPYQIRNRNDFEKNLTEMGYVIRDQWDIPSLGRIISTHPGLGPSVSRGYFLERRE